MSLVDVNQILSDLMLELEPLFFEGLSKVGNSSFEASRIRDVERELSDNDAEWFAQELINKLQDKWNCDIEYSQYDDYQVVHNDWRVCSMDGEAYKPKDRNYEFVGYVDKFDNDRFTFLQSEDDVIELRHQFLLDDEEFGYYIVEVGDGMYKRVMGTTGIHLSSPVYEYELEDNEL